MTDNILFVKEARTCSYVLVIHTPRLCGQPGFRSQYDSDEAALIRCREIVDSTNDQNSKPAAPLEADSPFKISRHRSNRASPPPAPSNEGEDKYANQRAKYDEILRALELLMSGKADNNLGQIVVEQISEDGGLLIEVVKDIPTGGEGDAEIDGGLTAEAITEAIRAAVQEARADKSDDRAADSEESPSAKSSHKAPEDHGVRDEL